MAYTQFTPRKASSPSFRLGGVTKDAKKTISPSTILIKAVTLYTLDQQSEDLKLKIEHTVREREKLEEVYRDVRKRRRELETKQRSLMAVKDYLWQQREEVSGESFGNNKTSARKVYFKSNCATAHDSEYAPKSLHAINY